MSYPDGSPTPEEMYYASQGAAASSAMPPAAPNASIAASYYGPPPPPPPDPALPPGIDPSWLQGQSPNPAARGAGLPPVDQVKPTPMGPTMPAQPPLATLPVINAAPTVIGPDEPGPVRQPVEQSFGDGPLYGPPVKAEGYASSHPAPRAVAGNSDPFGVKAEKRGLYGTFDAEEGAVQRGAETEESRANLMAGGMARISMQQQEEAQRQADEAAHAAELFRGHMEESQRQLDDVRSQKVDANRLYADDGSKVGAVLGGILGGIYQGLNKLEKNPFIEDMNRAIQQDIALQERNLSRKTSAIEQKQNMLGQLRAVYKDEAVAKLQAQNLMYEGAKQKLAAEAATYDSPAIAAKADQAITAIDRQQKGLKVQDALQQQAAAAAAAASAAAAKRAREQQEIDNYLKFDHANTEHMKAAAEVAKSGGERADKTNTQTQKLGDELSKPELVAARQTIDDLKAKVMKGRNPQTGAAEYDNTTRVPGTGAGAELRDDLFPSRPSLLTAAIPGYGPAHYLGKLDKEERASKLEWARLSDAYRVAVTGAGGGPEEIARLEKSFQGANTPEEQQTAIRLADTMLHEREARIRAGAPTEAVQQYDRRLKAEHSGRAQPVARTPVK